ncbi:regulator RcnB of Ni and Co efflux [Candidatus Pantoea varia]|uniref:Regulator RcnB of Ni and Co efflux n=1 Tax=Candidatus Pantoea varia TaxID=1881036 RepID=A0A1I5A8Y0_9GAMM|nr:RcnB family protein [Pantoea varia]SFN58927.1 regulator RcnB of Ni and Co efflux [Pantoea varia]
MKKTTLTLIASLLTCSTLFSEASRADDHDEGQRMPVPHQNDNHRPDNHGHDPDRGRDNSRGRDARNDRDHFAWQGHDFRRGHPVPPAYRGDHYRVADWHERGLREPPRGYHWANIDGNYVLIAAATGVITALVLNSALN